MGSPNVQMVGDSDFDAVVLKSSVPVLVDFTATWCGPCKALSPIVDKIADDYAGKIKVVKVDIDEAPETARKYGVRSVPNCIAFQGGQKGSAQAGLTNRETLLKMMGLS